MRIEENPLSLSGVDDTPGWTLAVHVDGISTGVVKRAGQEMCRISVTGDLDEETATTRLQAKARRWVAAYLTRQRAALKNRR